MLSFRSAATIGAIALLASKSTGPVSTHQSLASDTLPALTLLGLPEGKYSLGETLNTEVSNSIRAILHATTDGILRVKVTAHEGEIDGHLRYGFRGIGEFDGEEGELITTACFGDAGPYRLQVKGQFRLIELRFAHGKVTPPHSTSYRDRFDNVVQWRELDDHILVRIFPPTAFANTDTGYLPLLVDLTPLGFSRPLEGLSRIALTPLPIKGRYQVFTNMERTAALIEFGESITAIEAGIEACEQFFGHCPGTFVQQVLLANSRQPNAFFSCRDPRAIIMTDEMMRSGAPLAPVASHETIHLLDGAAADFGSRQLASIHRELLQEQSGRDFLLYIGESFFLPGGATGGHAMSNPSELFASFINSFVSTSAQEWEEVLRASAQRDPAFAVWYGKVLRILTPVLQSMCDENAPCFERIEKMQRFLEQLYEQHLLENPWKPVLG